MAQTIGAMTLRSVKVELSADGSAWIDVSGSVSGVSVRGGEREKHEFTPMFSDVTKAEFGARDRCAVTVKSVYTEANGEAFQILNAAYESNSVIYARWTPAGNLPGKYRYSTVNARVLKPAYPSGDASEARPLMVEYDLSAESIEKDVSE